MRIIAGSLRGRRLTAPKGIETRPTTDRVREAWFSILGPLEGKVLDLYAGTGALGFEALSRGASHAVFVESSKQAARVIESNAKQLDVLARISLLVIPVERARSALLRHAPFALILSDPPWTAWDAATRTLGRLLDSQLLTPTGRLVLGHPKGKPIALSEGTGLCATDERRWGDSAATFFELAAHSSLAPAVLPDSGPEGAR